MRCTQNAVMVGHVTPVRRVISIYFVETAAFIQFYQISEIVILDMQNNYFGYSE